MSMKVLEFERPGSATSQSIHPQNNSCKMVESTPKKSHKDIVLQFEVLKLTELIQDAIKIVKRLLLLFTNETVDE